MSDPTATRRELETAVRRLVGDTSDLTTGAAKAAKTVGPAVGVLGALLAYLWGRRRGRRRRTYVEIVRK